MGKLIDIDRLSRFKDKLLSLINKKSNIESIAIAANGNTHAAISAGKFVYVYNHSSLAEGIYKAKSTIAANGSLTTSNLSPLSEGISNYPQIISGTITATSLANFETLLVDTCATLDYGEFRFIEVYCNWSGSLTMGSRSLVGIYRPNVSNSGTMYQCYALLSGASGYYHSGSWHWNEVSRINFIRKQSTYTDITIPNTGYIKIDSFDELGVDPYVYFLISITPRGWSGHLENVTFSKSSTGTDIYMLGPAGTTITNVTVEYVFSNG